jgi:hypothetical protein
MIPELYDIDTPGAKTFGIKRSQTDEDWEYFRIDEFMFFLQDVGRINAYDPDKKTAVVWTTRYEKGLQGWGLHRVSTYPAEEIMREIKLNRYSRLYEQFVAGEDEKRALEKIKTEAI